jgi:hypothetical protein
MRLIIILVAVLVLFALIGWITFSNDSGRSSINVETDEIRQDTGEMLNKSSELLKEAEEEVTPSTEDEPTTSTTPIP